MHYIRLPSAHCAFWSLERSFLWPVVPALKLRHQFQFAGYYAAAAQGYFREEGLEVEIMEGAPGLAPASRLLSGEANFLPI